MASPVIVAGHLVVAPDQRSAYLAGCAEVVRAARSTDGCLDFAISADLLDASRINVFERWASQSAVEAFRGSGPSEEQGAAISSASVAEYDVAAHRALANRCSALSQEPQQLRTRKGFDRTPTGNYGLVTGS
jgi:quinol monooxygenase YgiN